MRHALAVVLAGLLFPACGEARHNGATAAAVEAPPRFVVGDVHHYAFAWTVQGTADTELLSGAPLSGGLELQGELQLRVLEGGDAATPLGIRITSLEESRLEVLGQNVLGDAADDLLGEEVVLLVPDDGDARRLFFAPGTTSLYQRVIAGLLANVDFGLARADDSWSRVARTGNGLAEVTYRREGDTVKRHVDQYARMDIVPGAPPDAPWRVDGETELRLDAAGVPTGIDTLELVALKGVEDPMSVSSSTRFSLDRTSRDRSSEPEHVVLDGWTEHDLHDPPDDAEAQREMARRFADGLTVTEFSTAVDSAARGLRPSPGFFVRARGLLRGWPEVAATLRDPYAEAPDERTRGFILDLLISAATPQAQSVLLDVLDAAPGDPEVPGLLQHLVLLRDPIPEVGLMLLEAHSEAQRTGDDELRRASLYPMGSIAAGLEPHDPVTARALLTLLRREFDAGTRAPDLEAALAGLANAGYEADVPRALALREHPDVDVRAQVASSLRISREPAAVDALFALLDDPERYVAASALSVIDYYLDDDGTLHRLATAAKRGAHHVDVRGPLIGVLAKRGRDDTKAHEALQAMLDTAGDPREQRRLRRILGA